MEPAASERSVLPHSTLALVHDYLNQRGGAERVFAWMASAWPDAPIYTALYDERVVGDLFAGHPMHLSSLARIPFANRAFRYLAPFYPRAFEAFDLRAYDVVLSSSSAWAKGVITRPDAVHLSYIYTVSRFVFAYDEYLGGFGLRSLARPIVAPLVKWDRRAALRPTHLIADSQNVARRIAKYYGREAQVLHPPVDLQRFTPGKGGAEYFFIASRLLPYKRVDLAIDAAQRARVPLLVAGCGPMEAALRRRARGTTTTMLGFVDDARIVELMREARAVILPGNEDFGLVPFEAAACARPTIAYRGGGALETVDEGVSGEFFDDATPESLASVLRSFDERRYDLARIRAHAQAHSVPAFLERLGRIVENAIATRG